MVNRKDLLALNFYKKTCFFGSLKKMHYKIEMATVTNEEEENKIFKVTYWPGPYILSKTPDNLKQYAEFPFSEEGLQSVADFLNEQYEKQKELWEA